MTRAAAFDRVEHCRVEHCPVEHCRAAAAGAAPATATAGWLSALLLMVLLAAGNLPSTRDAVASSIGVVECHDQVGRRAQAMKLGIFPPPPSPVAARRQPPRVTARARSIADAGLPPARAPTA